MSFWLGIGVFFLFALVSAAVAFIGLRQTEGDPSLDSGDLGDRRLATLAEVEEEQTELAGSYGWADQGKKLVRVPASKAIELAVAGFKGSKGVATDKVIPGTKTAMEIFEREQAAKKKADAAAPVAGGEGGEKASGPVEEILLKAVPNLMQFDQKTLQVTAGATVKLTFQNPDILQHNFVLCAAGSKQTVGNAANQMMTQPDAMQKQYVPEVPEVLTATDLVGPNSATELTFTAPAEPGEYPYLCTFPGHWMIMNGVLTVVAAE